MKEVLQKENKILRKVSREVKEGEIESDEIKILIREMKETLSKSKDGVALAAPQIGEPVRIFVVSGHVFCEESDFGEEPKEKSPPDLVFINPKITKTSKEKVSLEEGCLSVRDYYGTMERAKKVTIEALDENGKKFEMGSSGFLAQIFQHEVDHLNGILFIDTAKNVREIKNEK